MNEVFVANGYWISRKLVELLYGKIKEQYGKVHDYCDEMIRTSPQSTLKVMNKRQIPSASLHFSDFTCASML